MDSAAMMQEHSLCSVHESTPLAAKLHFGNQRVPITESDEDQEGQVNETAWLLSCRDCAALQHADLAQALLQALLSPQWC